MLTIHPDSHLDHGVSPALLAYVCDLFAHKTGFFLKTIELPAELAVGLESRIWGPIEGDEPVPQSEVVWEVRGSRPWASRMTNQPARPTRWLTVIAGPRGGDTCSLYTAFGGKAAPREPWDTGLATPEERKESHDFWAQHALCR